jgi:hypothetical protein
MSFSYICVMDIAHKKAVILGLGQSVLNYRKKPDDVTFGVNDIFRYFETDYTIVVDGKARFEDERLKHIVNTKGVLVSQLPEWIKGVRMFELIQIKPFTIMNMSSKHICYSNNSTFVATTFAFQKGFRVFDIYGVDLAGHNNLDNGMNRKKFIEDWRKLIEYLRSNNCEVNIYCKLKDLI